jgi:spermidine/putrescine transport system substrate-binding protein
MKKFKKIISVASALSLCAVSLASFSGCSTKSETVVLRVCNWEEYIDLGGWDDDEVIDIDNPYAADGKEGILGTNSIVEDFTEWFNENHDYEVKVEYSTFGTNEDLYNRLSLGDVYDLVCPSDYMIMQLIASDSYVEFSDEFWDTDIEENYYAKYVSSYIDGEDVGIFNKEEYNWHKKAACYMWGTTGVVYNPDKLIDESDVSSWNILLNENYKKQVTIKDNVRDAYFATLGIINSDTLLSDDLSEQDRIKILNDTDTDTINAAQDVLKQIKENVYSFETDAGKSDMVTGKVIANYQWSGDSVYIMDEAESDSKNPTELWYSVPDECTNLWFDGWMMLKSGINGDEKKQEAAEAFVNFLSRPDNAVRNMYYIGYTSSIADQTVFDYMDWTYGMVFDPSDEEWFDEDIVCVYEYDLNYFFGDTIEDGAYLYVDASTLGFDTEENDYELVKLGEEYGNDIEYAVYSNLEINRGRQLFAQYPPQNVINRSVVMLDFGSKLSDINTMWINVRCLDLVDIPIVTICIVAAVIVVIAAAIILYRFRYKLFKNYKPKQGYKKQEKTNK